MLGIATARPISNRNGIDAVFTNQVFQFLFRMGDPLLRHVGIDHVVFEDRAGFVECGEFAARAEAGIDGEHPLAANGRLEQ